MKFKLENRYDHSPLTNCLPGKFTALVLLSCFLISMLENWIPTVPDFLMFEHYWKTTGRESWQIYVSHSFEQVYFRYVESTTGDYFWKSPSKPGEMSGHGVDMNLTYESWKHENRIIVLFLDSTTPVPSRRQPSINTTTCGIPIISYESVWRRLHWRDTSAPVESMSKEIMKNDLQSGEKMCW